MCTCLSLQLRFILVESPLPFTCKTRMPLTSAENLHELGVRVLHRSRPRACCLDVAEGSVDLASSCWPPLSMWSALGGQ